VTCLWLIGGTQESRSLVEQILSALSDAISPPSLLVSVTTDTAKTLYPMSEQVKLWVGKLTAEQGDRFITTHRISAILDASHPFATEVSALAIAIGQRHSLPYLRYERARLAPEEELHWQDATGRPGNVIVPRLDEVFARNYLTGERTLLTLGYRRLAAFSTWQSQGTLFARILPSESALATALTAGFTPDRLIALRPPVSPPLEAALWQHWQITQVVTKASGAAGGEHDKQAIAAKLGIRLIRLARPAMSYPNATTESEVAVNFALSAVTHAP